MPEVFPFSAIVGQDDMKLGMLVTAVDPTAVRGLSALLPPMRVVTGCRYNCDPAHPAGFCPECRARLETGRLKEHKTAVPVVDLPLGAT